MGILVRYFVCILGIHVFFLPPFFFLFVLLLSKILLGLKFLLKYNADIESSENRAPVSSFPFLCRNEIVYCEYFKNYTWKSGGVSCPVT